MPGQFHHCPSSVLPSSLYKPSVPFRTGCLPPSQVHYLLAYSSGLQPQMWQAACRTSLNSWLAHSGGNEELGQLLQRADKLGKPLLPNSQWHAGKIAGCRNLDPITGSHGSGDSGATDRQQGKAHAFFSCLWFLSSAIPLWNKYI